MADSCSPLSPLTSPGQQSPASPLSSSTASKPQRLMSRSQSFQAAPSSPVPYAQVSFPARSNPVGVASAKLPCQQPGSRGYVSPLSSPSVQQPVRRRTLPAEGKVRERAMSFEESQSEAPVLEKPPMKRGDSLSRYQPMQSSASEPKSPFRLVGKVEDLPSNPKSWTPSQLALYLAHVLKLTPAPIIEDLITLVFRHGLTGRRFLRLREKDLRELDINPSWARLFSHAREKLRRVALRGHTDDRPEDLPEESCENLTPSLAPPLNFIDRRSWRKDVGSKSRGRVKEMADWFAQPRSQRQAWGSDDSSVSIDVNRPQRRSISGASSLPELALQESEATCPSPLLCKSDSEEPPSEGESITSDVSTGIKWDEIEPLPVSPPFTEKATVSPGRMHAKDISDLWLEEDGCYGPYQSRISSHGHAAYSPIKLPSGFMDGTSALFRDPEKPEENSTIKPSSNSRDSTPAHSRSNTTETKLSSLFSPPLLETPGSGAATDHDERTSVKSPSGSMILVKKKDLDEIHKRLAEMEGALDQLQLQQEIDELAQECQDGKETQQQPTVWIPPSQEIDSICGLSSWVVMTAVGVGIVAAEVIIGKVRSTVPLSWGEEWAKDVQQVIQR